VVGLIKLLMNDNAGLTNSMDQLGKVKGIAQAEKMAKAMVDPWQRFASAIEAVRIAFGQKLLATLNPLIERLTVDYAVYQPDPGERPEGAGRGSPKRGRRSDLSSGFGVRRPDVPEITDPLVLRSSSIEAKYSSKHKAGGMWRPQESKQAAVIELCTELDRQVESLRRIPREPRTYGINQSKISAAPPMI
jgi:hypothetical protein